MNKDQYSEDALALAFAEHFANELRFVQATSPYKWFVYIEGEWKAENTNYVLDLVRCLCRAAAANCGDPALAREICSFKNINAVLALARTDRRLAATKDQLGIVAKNKRGKP
jgi:putative DNA primase/helicase